MPTYTDRAIIVRGHNLGEADRIVTMITQHQGRVRAVARGVRRTSSRFGGRLEPANHVLVQIAIGRSLDLRALHGFAGDPGGSESALACRR